MNAHEPNPDQRRTAARNKPAKPPEGGSPLGRLDAEALESQRAHERDLADRGARPVEEREPVGPYAPTRTPNLDDRAAAAPEQFESGYRQGWRERHVYGAPRYKGLPTLTNRPEGGTELGDYLVEQFGSVGTRIDGLVDVVLGIGRQMTDNRVWESERFDRIDTALAKLTDLFVDSRDEIERIKASAECTIDHSSEPVQMVQFKEAFERGRQQGDADRAQRGLAEFMRGRSVGRSEREAELLDQGWAPPGVITEQIAATTWDPYPAHWTADERTAERRHREKLLSLVAETEARTLADQVNYPTEYEVWRDAVSITGAQRDRRPPAKDLADRLTADAEWFWELLQQVPVLKFEDRTKPGDALADRYEDDRSGPAE